MEVLRAGGSVPAPAKPALLERITTVNLDRVETFSPYRFFRNSGIRLWFGSNFEYHFLNGAEPIEIGARPADLQANKLRRSARDEAILRELGGETVAEISLAHFAELIRRQANGEPGVLLVNGWWNVFYIRDWNGVIWAVFCRWFSSFRVWSVEAYPVTYPHGWCADDRVVSRVPAVAG